MILCPDAENHLRSPEIVPLNRRRSAPLVLSVSPSTTHRPFFTVSASGSLGSRVSPEIDLSRRKSASALLDAGNGASGRPLVLTHGRGSGFIGSHPGSLPLDQSLNLSLSVSQFLSVILPPSRSLPCFSDLSLSSLISPWVSDIED